jgi:hypothetical protein
MEAAEARSREEIAAFADTLSKQPEWKHILRLLKNDILVKWANEADNDAREDLWYHIQAIGKLEVKVKVLADEKHVTDRKEAAAEKRKTPGV